MAWAAAAIMVRPAAPDSRCGRWKEKGRDRPLPELTRILDTVKDANGAFANGRVAITPSRAFAAADGTAVAGGPLLYAVVNGVVDLFLAPTEDADLSDGPAVTYKAEYFLKNRGRYSETWTVPRAAGGPYTISQLRGT